MSNALAIRSSAYTGSIKFEDAAQCYATPRNLVHGDNGIVEVWAYATQDHDPGIHTVLANGDGGSGWLIIQSGDQWQLFVGGVGGVGGIKLGKVKADAWTHLAVVRDRGITSAWIDGKKVANALPAGGGGANNFSLGASPTCFELHCVAAFAHSTMKSLTDRTLEVLLFCGRLKPNCANVG